MTDTIVAGYARTPFARYLGQLASTSSTVLGGHAGAAALAQAGVTPESVQSVIVGQVLPAAVGQNPPRQAAVAAGVPIPICEGEGQVKDFILAYSRFHCLVSSQMDLLFLQLVSNCTPFLCI